MNWQQNSTKRKTLLVIDDSIIQQEIYKFYAHRIFPFDKIEMDICKGLEDWHKYKDKEYDFCIIDWKFENGLRGMWFCERVKSKRKAIITGMKLPEPGMYDYCSKRALPLYFKPLKYEDVEKILKDK